MQTPIIELKNITKYFPGIIANNSISLTIQQGEIFALLGENGAGKSTLMSILFGMYTPDEGEIYIRGKLETIHSPRDATSLNIGMVHQHFKLVDTYTIAENVILGMEPQSHKFGFIPYLNTKTVEVAIKELSEHYGLNVDPAKRIDQINVSMMQRVEIIKMLYRNAEILIFDEPSAVLTPQEIDNLLTIIRKLRDDGKTIILISHKLEEIIRVADRCAVLRKGELVATLNVAETTTAELARLMVGRDVAFELEKSQANFGDVVLEIDQLCAKNTSGYDVLKDISFAIRAGEIFAIAGVSGNGQVELAQAICGLYPISAGRIRLHSRDITSLPLSERLRNAIAYIPEDRQNDALILDFNLAENMVLKCYDKAPFIKRGILQEDAFIDYSDRAIAHYDIRCARGSQTTLRDMSGGNQQKCIIAREIDLPAPLMIFVQPTRGLDIGAIEHIHQQIIAQRNLGKAILLISLELDEIIQLADTIGVIYNGRLVKISDAQQINKHQLGEYMMGVSGKDEQ